MSEARRRTGTSLVEAFARFLLLGTLAAVSVAGRAEPRVVRVKLTSAGFEPNEIRLPAGQPAVLEVTRVTEATCAREVVVPDLRINQELPLDRPVRIKIEGAKPGRHPFGCAMSLMVGGTLIVGDAEPAKPKPVPKPSRPDIR